MSCGCKCEQEADKSPSLLDEQSAYDKAIDIIMNVKPDELTQEVTYMDENCHGCLVGHILKVTDGLNYKDYQANLGNSDQSIIKNLMKKNFGEGSYDLDQELSTIHDDWINDEIEFEEMQKEAINCLKTYKTGRTYGYEAKYYGEDWDDDDYYEAE